MSAELRAFLVFGYLCALVPLSLAEDAARPARLAVEPNAILRLEQPLTLEVEVVKEGESVQFEVYGDCLDKEVCPPLFARKSTPANKQGVVRDSLLYKELVDGGVASPQGRRLWLRVSFPGSTRYRQAMFGYVEDECSLFDIIFDAFRFGACDPGVAQVLRNHRQRSTLADSIFEVRRIAVIDSAAAPVAVPGTRGATGVAWLDGETLLVTTVGAAGEGSLAAGLYQVALDPKVKPRLLWSPQGEEIPTAPRALAGERIAFVVQAQGPQRPGEGAVAWLVVWQAGEELTRLELPYKVHQILASDLKGEKLLTLSLGVGDNRPTLLAVDLAAGEVTVVGFSNALYEAALRKPGGELAVIAFENNFANYGWEMALTRGGELVRPLVKRNGENDMAPVWKPEGDEVAFLAEVGKAR